MIVVRDFCEIHSYNYTIIIIDVLYHCLRFATCLLPRKLIINKFEKPTGPSKAVLAEVRCHQARVPSRKGALSEQMFDSVEVIENVYEL